MTSDYDIFISCKNTGADGSRTEDSIIAENLHNYLVKKGYHVFTSTSSLADLGVAKNKDPIDHALDQSKILVIVGTSVGNINSEWVRYEWDSFFNDILGGSKPDAKVFAYIKNVKINDLPGPLRYTQCIEAGPDGFDNLCRLIDNALVQHLSTKFSADTVSGKSPLKVAFKDESLGKPTQFMWDFGDGGKSTEQNPVHIYEKPGSYSVKLTLSNEAENNSLEKKDIISVRPRIIPKAGFSVNANAGKVPFEAIFQDVSSGNPTKFSWDFGDGGSSDLKDPTHTYEKPGNYSVTLAVSNDDGKDSIKQKDIISVRPRIIPKAGFSVNANTGKVPFEAIFKDVSSGNPTKFFWDFGDGGSSDLKDPTHTYEKPGEYSVTLTVSNDDGPDKIIQPGYILVVTPPKGPELNSDYDISDYDIFISSKNTHADGRSTEDSLIAEKLHIYLVEKGFHVFTSTISLADLGVDTYKVAIDNALDHSKILIVVGTSVENINSEWVKYEWNSFSNDILGGYKPNGKVFAYIKNVKTNDLPRALRYTQCIVAGPDGFDKLYRFINNALGQRLNAKFSADTGSGKSPLKVTFKDESLGNPIQFMWDFGDGGKSTERNPVHIYEKPGLYSVKLTLSNEADTNSFEQKNIISVHPHIIPKAGFSVNANTGKVPFEVVFTDASSGNPTKYFWDFGDNCSSDSKDPVHIYEKPGKYTVTLTVSNDDGSDIITKPGYIQVIAPREGYTQKTSFNIPLVVISAILLIAIIAIGAWALNGPGPSQPIKGPIQNAQIDPTLASNFSLDHTSGPAPLSVRFTDTSEGVPDTWLWDFGDGSSSAKQNPVYMYQIPGTYQVQLMIAKNGSARTPSSKQTISVTAPVTTVIPPPITDSQSTEVPSGKLDFSANKVINSLYTVYFEASNVPNGTYSYHWDFGDQRDSFSKTGVNTYYGSGEYLITLRIETPSGSMMKVKTVTLTNEGGLTIK